MTTHIVSGCITIIKSSQQLTLNHWVFPPLLLQSTVNSQQCQGRCLSKTGKPLTISRGCVSSISLNMGSAAMSSLVSVASQIRSTNNIDSGCTVRIVDCWLLTVDGRVKKMKIALIICCDLDESLRPTFEARIWYHSGMTAGIDITSPLLFLGNSASSLTGLWLLWQLLLLLNVPWLVRRRQLIFVFLAIAKFANLLDGSGEFFRRDAVFEFD